MAERTKVKVSAATPENRLRNKQIAKRIKAARKHWADNRDIYEHDVSDIKSNPLFKEKRFASYLHEFAFERNIKEGLHEELRKALVAGLPKAIQDDSGKAIDNLEQGLRRRFSSHKPPQRLISVVSETAAFLRPKTFVPWDRFSGKGLNKTLGRGQSKRYKSYQEYLADFNLAWRGAPGESVRQFVDQNSRAIAADMKSSDLPKGLETKPRFQRRVLDFCLMKLGEE